MSPKLAFAVVAVLAKHGISAQYIDPDAIGITQKPAQKQLTHADKQRLAAAEAKRQRKAAKRNGK